MFTKVSEGGYRRACRKCSGSGIYVSYSTVNHEKYQRHEGVCFRCDGKGIEPRAKWFATEAELVAHYGKLEAQNEAKYQKDLAARQAASALEAAGLLEAEKRREQERQAAFDAQEYVAGEFGEIVNVGGVVLASFSVDTSYGVSRLVKIQAGNAIVKFFSSAKFAFDIEEGDEVQVYGELVSREVYQGNKETTIKKTKLAA